MTFSTLLVFLSLIHSTLQLLGDTERFWTTDSLTGFHYQINSQSALSWHQARKSCQQQNAELLSITEIQEQTYLREITKNMDSALWIGLNSLNFNSGWQWMGSSPLRYLNWAPGSPIPAPGKLCAMLNPRRASKWENQACNQKHGYICKRGNSTLESLNMPSDHLGPIKCPDGWLPYSGHCYMIHREPKVWKEALTSCKKQDGNLASMHNIAENSFIVSQLGYTPTEDLWIGLNALKIQMYFEWSDGTPVTYIKWLRGQPSYAKRQEDCVVMKGQDGYWAANVCEKKLGYICKRTPLPQAPREVEIIDPGCQRGWKRHGFHCYLVGHTFVTFSEANKTCERSNGYLATVEDRNEQAYLISLIGLRPEKYFWIGLSDVEERGTFKWTDGEAVLFTHWNSAMPGGKSGCVAMGTGIAAGLWDVLSCENTAKFLCKQWADGVTHPPIPLTTLAPTCPEGWDSSNFISSCFKIFVREGNQKKSWFEAEDFCREIGGHLITINRKEVKHLIWQMVLDKGFIFQHFWMGLIYLNPDEGYTWIDGSPVIYENWNEEEPNNDKGIEHCGTFEGSPKMQWNDLYCEHLLNWICEIKKGIPLKPEPSTKFDYKVTDDGWVIYEDKQYYFSTENVHMEKAWDICKKKFADLAVIDSESERKFLWRYIYTKNRMNSYFIGLTVSFDQKFSWLDGTPVNYVAWAPNEPNFANNDENCVVMNKDFGFWNDINCGIKNAFICERHNRSSHSEFASIAPSPLGGCPETWLLFNNKCYKIFGSSEAERLTWHAARNTCIKLGGNLPSIHNEQVQAFLTFHLKDVMAETWIGLNDINMEGHYLWTDGSLFDYAKWARNFPFRDSYIRVDWTLVTQETDCIAMMKRLVGEEGKWGNNDCQQNKSYICQMDSNPDLFHSPAIPASDIIHYGNSSYSIIRSKMNWEEARNNCKKKSLELASILDYYSALFLWLYMLQFGEPAWVGLNSNVTDGYYKWTDNRRIKYSNWARGEPKQKIACVYLDLDGTWKTASCDENYFSVCKRSDVIAPTDPPQLPGKCPKSRNPLSWIPFRGHCYFFNVHSNSWAESSTECTRLGATLVSIEDLAESKFLADIIEPHKGETSGFWTGIYRNVDGLWLWLDKTAVDFVNWNKGQPSSNQFEYCVEMSASSGYWNTIPCSSQKGSICKKPKMIEAQPSENLIIKKEAPAHSTVWILIILVLILLGAGLTAYFLFRKKRQNKLQTDASFNNVLLEHRDTVTGESDTKDSVDKKDQNEHTVI
ncbi:macrophage mannose receptor 1-like isoform X1 [Malaclemys terrapin pileata]|uniref:macrophage mannose receptor 1-like isoform X1 n=1 Tax=Malaclemys terrapin pileata TaxID=2991368 RepID=UPI0023A877FC|nr:macrophage mannose receptor 1-like isoform X1 [Malaclemys terrapin pileata]